MNMAKRGALSIEEKQQVLDTVKSSEDFEDQASALAEDMDRTEDILLKYYQELKDLGLVVSSEDEVEEVSQVNQEMEKIKRDHMQQIYPSQKGATVGTPMASQYTDEINKKRSSKPKMGKYAANVQKIRKDQ
jgi:conjugal transfer/entry exclusion protein